MQKLTLDQIKKLKYGDEVTLVQKFPVYIKIKKLTYMGRTPKHGDSYCVFYEHGMNETHIFYFNNMFSNKDYYFTEHIDKEFIGRELIKFYEEQIKSIKKIYGTR